MLFLLFYVMYKASQTTLKSVKPNFRIPLKNRNLKRLENICNNLLLPRSQYKIISTWKTCFEEAQRRNLDDSTFSILDVGIRKIWAREKRRTSVKKKETRFLRNSPISLRTSAWLRKRLKNPSLVRVTRSRSANLSRSIVCPRVCRTRSSNSAHILTQNSLPPCTVTHNHKNHRKSFFQFFFCKFCSLAKFIRAGSIRAASLSQMTSVFGRKMLVSLTARRVSLHHDVFSCGRFCQENTGRLVEERRFVNRKNRRRFLTTMMKNLRRAWTPLSSRKSRLVVLAATVVSRPGSTQTVRPVCRSCPSRDGNNRSPPTKGTLARADYTLFDITSS